MANILYYKNCLIFLDSISLGTLRALRFLVLKTIRAFKFCCVGYTWKFEVINCYNSLSKACTSRNITKACTSRNKTTKNCYSYTFAKLL